MPTDKIQQMTDAQVSEMFDCDSNGRMVEYQAFTASLTPQEKAEFQSRIDAIVNRPRKKSFWKATGLLLTMRFADFAEYTANGDTEN